MELASVRGTYKPTVLVEMTLPLKPIFTPKAHGLLIRWVALLWVVPPR